MLIGVILGYTPSASLNGFFSFAFIGIWVSYTVGILIRIKKMREYHSRLNDGVLLFGNLFISLVFGIWGDFTPILSQNFFVQIKIWNIIFTLPYIVFGLFSLSAPSRPLSSEERIYWEVYQFQSFRSN